MDTNNSNNNTGSPLPNMDSLNQQTPQAATVQNQQSKQPPLTPPQAPTVPPATTTSPVFPDPSQSAPQPQQAPPIPAQAVPAQSGITPPPSPTQGVVESDSKSSGGKLLFVIVFILIILALVGGYLLYVFSQNQSAAQPETPAAVMPVEPTPTEEPVASASAVEQLQDVSESDELEAIEEDINAHDFTQVDEEVETLEQTL